MTVLEFSVLLLIQYDFRPEVQQTMNSQFAATKLFFHYLQSKVFVLQQLSEIWISTHEVCEFYNDSIR